MSVVFPTAIDFNTQSGGALIESELLFQVLVSFL
jgi:hypothetical protein